MPTISELPRLCRLWVGILRCHGSILLGSELRSTSLSRGPGPGRETVTMLGAPTAVGRKMANL